MAKFLTHTGQQLDATIGAFQGNYADVSETTAQPSDVLEGKTFVDATKVERTGTLKNISLGRVVTFRSGGEKYSIISVPAGGKVTRPPNPFFPSGFIFDGWYTQELGAGTEISFPYQPSADITLYSSAYAIITSIITHGTATGSTTIQYGGTGAVYITAGSGYKITSQSIVVSGAYYEYSISQDGKSCFIGLSNPQGSVGVFVICEAE